MPRDFKISQWLSQKIHALPDKPGVYLFKDRLGSVLYVGKAKSLRKRVQQYFRASSQDARERPKIASMLTLIKDLETIVVNNEPESLILEGRLIKQWRPKYNTDFVDDKRFPWIRIDVHNTLPRLRLVRQPLADKSKYFGPFLQDRAVTRTLEALKKKFGILLNDACPREIAPGVYALYDDVRAQIYKHPNEVTVEQYRYRVDEACAFLEGHTRDWLESCRVQMIQFSEQQQYEKAAQLRDLITALEHTTFKTRKFTRELPRAPMGRDSLNALAAALGLETPPEHIECFDISHISGSFTVASMVHFSGGKADKSQYRRYKIRSFEGNDDYRAMEEVVGRRYRRLHQQGNSLPDLVVIDGGKGQVRAALKAFLILGVDAPPLVGLAKRLESVVFPDARGPMRLPLSHPGLQLLQRMRDEAHRYANSFNADLRARKIKESLLDEIAGLGPSRRIDLIKHFGSIQRLRKATLEDIQLVPGIGPKLAQSVFEGLRRSDPRS